MDQEREWGGHHGDIPGICPVFSNLGHHSFNLECFFLPVSLSSPCPPPNLSCRTFPAKVACERSALNFHASLSNITSVLVSFYSHWSLGWQCFAGSSKSRQSQSNTIFIIAYRAPRGPGKGPYMASRVFQDRRPGFWVQLYCLLCEVSPIDIPRLCFLTYK